MWKCISDSFYETDSRLLDKTMYIGHNFYEKKMKMGPS